MNRIICPKCKEPLIKQNKSFKCVNGHCFDIAKEGYANLLLSNKSGEFIGDSKKMAKSRKDFLSKGYYGVLAEEILKIISFYDIPSPFICDVCCGEGYYSSFLAERIPQSTVCGFDISKEMIKLAAKRKSKASYFVANMTALPLENECADFVLHLFAPFNESEISRIMKKCGILISVSPGENHLLSLKKVLYDKAYLNEENTLKTDNLVLCCQKKISNKIKLLSQEDISALFKMTPYYYHCPKDGAQRLENLETLETETEFIINIFKTKELFNGKDL